MPTKAELVAQVERLVVERDDAVRERQGLRRENTELLRQVARMEKDWRSKEEAVGPHLDGPPAHADP